MTRKEILLKLRHAMKQSAQDKVDLDWDAVTEESTIESLGFDSLAMLDLIYDIQQEFGVQFEAEEMIGVKTVGQLTTFLQGKIAS